MSPLPLLYASPPAEVVPADVAPAPAPPPPPSARSDGASGPPPARSAPESPAPNAVYFELLGSGILYSLSYERLIPPLHVGLRAGASFVTYKVSRASGSGNLVFATFPVTARYYLGPPRHKLELGLGATVTYFAASSDSTGLKIEGPGAGLGVAASGVVGYRYVPPGGGFTFGAAFTPLLRAEKGFLPWGGADVGYAF